MGAIFLVKLGLWFYLFAINSWSWLPLFYTHVKVVLELSVTCKGRFDLHVICDLYHIESILFSTDFFRPKPCGPDNLQRGLTFENVPLKSITKPPSPVPPGLPWAFDRSLAQLLIVYGVGRTYGRFCQNQNVFWCMDNHIFLAIMIRFSCARL